MQCLMAWFPRPADGAMVGSPSSMEERNERVAGFHIGVAELGQHPCGDSLERGDRPC
jgi:hypothetical protein